MYIIAAPILSLPSLLPIFIAMLRRQTAPALSLPSILPVFIAMLRCQNAPILSSYALYALRFALYLNNYFPLHCLCSKFTSNQFHHSSMLKFYPKFYKSNLEQKHTFYKLQGRLRGEAITTQHTNLLY